MSVARKVVFALALAAPVAGLGPAAPTARAAAPAPGGATALPAPEAPADGPAVDLWLALWAADGAPITGFTGSVSASVGAADPLVELGGGLYRVPYAAKGVGDAKEARVTLKGKHAGRPIEVVVPVAIGPSRAAPRAVVSPAAITLGRDERAQVSVQGASRAGVLLRSSAGTVRDAGAASPGGAWSATLAPPTERPPRVALLTYADAADPLGRAGHVAVPMAGAIDFPVTGAAGASVLLEIGGERFGPAVLDGDGRGRVPIVAKPGATTATQIAVKDGAETKTTIDLKIPEARRLALYPLPASVPADGRTVTLRAAVVTPSGEPDLAAKPTFQVSAGAVGAAEPAGDGVYRATWTLPDAGGSATVSVSLGSAVQTDSVEVKLGVGVPAAVSLTVSPDPAPAGAELAVKVAATTAAGKPLAVGEPSVALLGAEALGSAREGDGWVVRARPAPQGPIRATVHWSLPASGNPAAEVAVVPERSAVGTDGAPTVDLRIHAFDAFGAPVADRTVALTVEGGGGRIEPAEVVTGPDGTARATYTAGAEPGYVGLRARSEDLSQVVVLGQFPDGKPPVPVPPHPSPRAKAITPTLRLARLDAPASAPASAGPVVSLAVDGVAAPGATVTVVAALRDAAGAVDRSATPSLTASAGTLAAPVVQPDGTVSAVLSIPPEHQGPIELVADAGGRTAKVVVGDDAAAGAWGDPAPSPAGSTAAGSTAAGSESAGAELAATTPVAADPAPASPASWPWLRARVSGVVGTYRYQQSPAAEPGPLLPATLAVGGGAGGAPAVPGGVEGDVRLWLDAIGAPWIGVHGQVRAAAYSIGSSAFEGRAEDTLWNGAAEVVGRAPFTLAGDRYWVGAKAGFHYGDLLLFAGDLAPGSQIRFLGLAVPGLGVGPELGAEVGRFHVVAGYTLGLARGTQPWSSGIDLEAGFAPLDALYLSAGVSSVSRNAVLTGEDSGLDRGAIDDASLVFKLGVGFAL